MRKVTVITNREKDSGAFWTNKVVEILRKHDLTADTHNMIHDDIDTDMIVCLGGDGTILNIASQIAVKNIPILGINLGRVGYIAELETDDIWMIEKIFSGEYFIDKRMMLKIEYGDREYIALNDVVLSNNNIAHLTDILLICDENIVNTYRADGLIIATPTGSTAYSMSAGGSVVDPKLDCICVTPVCSHSLSAKPLIFSPQSQLHIVNKCRTKSDMHVSVDGNINLLLEYDMPIKISKSDIETKFIRMKKDGFYNILNKKMAES